MKYINSELQSDRGNQGDRASSKHHVMASKLAEIEIRTPQQIVADYLRADDEDDHQMNARGTTVSEYKLTFDGFYY